PTSFSLLYAANTLGAVLGAGLTGFVCLRVLGMQHTLWLAAGVNFLVALAAGLGSLIQKSAERRVPSAEANSVDRTDRPPSAGSQQPALGTQYSVLGTSLPLTCAALTGAVTTGLEVGWARVLGVLTLNSAYGFALLLTVLLLGLAAGSLLQWAW